MNTKTAINLKISSCHNKKKEKIKPNKVDNKYYFWLHKTNWFC